MNGVPCPFYEEGKCTLDIPPIPGFENWVEIPHSKRTCLWTSLWKECRGYRCYKVLQKWKGRAE